MDDAIAQANWEETKQLWREVFKPSGTYFIFPAERLDPPSEEYKKSKRYKEDGPVDQVIPTEPGAPCPVSDEHLDGQFAGKIVLGIVPVTPDGKHATVLTGDIDTSVDMPALCARARELGLPIRFHWTKSGGAHFVGPIPDNTPVLQAHQASRGIAVLLGLDTSGDAFEAYPKLAENQCLFNCLCGDRLGGVDAFGEPQRPKQWLLEVASLPVPTRAKVKEWARLGRDDGATAKTNTQDEPEQADATHDECVEFAHRWLDHHCRVLSDLRDGRKGKAHGIGKHMARMRDADGHWIDKDEVRERVWEAGQSAGMVEKEFDEHFWNGWAGGLRLTPEVYYAPGGKPIIHLVPGLLTQVVDDAEDALLQHADIYQRGDHVVRASPEPILVSDKRMVEGLRLVRVSPSNLREHMGEAAQFQTYDKRSRRWSTSDVPYDIAHTYLARVGEWRLRPLTGIAGAPTLRADGSILDTPGYDAATGILLDTGGMVFPPIPIEPSRADAETALALLMGLGEEYPFVDGPSRSVWMSALLTGVSRLAYDHTPLHAFSAPTAGSGKSNAVDTAGMLATGHPTPVIVATDDEKEMEKRLGAILLSGDILFSLDNVEHPLGGMFLNQVLSQTLVKTRILGKSETPTMVSNALVCATGNNLSVRNDMVRRSLLCQMDPRVERPELREFKNTDPVLRARAQRAAYVVAGLTVLRAHVVAGSPAMRLVPLAGFDQWSRMVRSALVWMGMDDPVTTQEQLRSLDEDVDQIELVFSALEGMDLLHHTFTATRLVRLAEDAEADWNDGKSRALFHALQSVARGRGGAIDPTRLGYWLNRNKNRIVGGRLVKPDGKTDGVRRWLLTTVRGSSLAAE